MRQPAHFKKNNFLYFFCGIFLSFFLLISLLFAYVYSKEKANHRALWKSHAESQLNNRYNALSQIFNVVIDDLLIFAHSNETKNIFETGGVTKDFTEDLVFFSTRKKIYDQIRLLDIKGQELLRINYQNGTPVVVSKHQLQDKSDRYYFTKSIPLQYNEIFVSPFDLNMEQGQIEKPFKPVIRFCTPVFNSSGEKLGVAVFNFLGNYLLRQLDQDSSVPGKISLLNSGGYWLKNHDHSLEWAFMFKDKNKINFINFFPAAWQKIVAQDNGHFNFDNGMINFTTIYPLLDSGQTSLANSYFWKLVYHLDANAIESLGRKHRNYLLTFFSASVFIILIIAILASKTMSKLHDARNEKNAKETQIRQSEERLRLLMESAGEGIIGLDAQGFVTFMNPTATQILDFDSLEAVGKSIHNVIHYSCNEETPIPVEDCQFCQALQDQKPVTVLSDTFFRRDGSSFPVEYNSTPIMVQEQFIGSVIVFNDITARQELEKENLYMHQHVQQYQKHQSLTSMAAGIAHNFNNILTAVIGYLDITLMSMPPGQKEYNYIEQASKASLKAAKLSSMMLRYVGQGKLERQEFDIAKLIDDMKEMLEALTDHQTSIRFMKINDSTLINGDPNLVRQLIVNLVTNAAVSFEDIGGEIIIKCGQQYYSANELKTPHLQTDLQEGHYVYVEVQDTGKGMKAEERARTFEPFYSTKFTGRGMGLATVLGTMRNHNGTIFLNSIMGKGTVAKALFPAYTSTEEPFPEYSVTPIYKQMSGTVLLADDDPMVVSVEQSYLEQLGFDVLVASDGIEALDIYSNNQESICLVLLDVAMPRLDGITTLKRLRKTSQVPVIMVTGYSIDKISSKISDIPGMGYIQKPFSIDTFSKNIQEVLDRCSFSS